MIVLSNDTTPGPVNRHSVLYGVCTLSVPAFLPIGLSLDVFVVLELAVPDLRRLFFLFVDLSALEARIAAGMGTGVKIWLGEGFLCRTRLRKRIWHDRIGEDSALLVETVLDITLRSIQLGDPNKLANAVHELAEGILMREFLHRFGSRWHPWTRGIEALKSGREWIPILIAISNSSVKGN